PANVEGGVRKEGRACQSYFFRRYAISAANPPTNIIARITRSRLTIQAMPIPRAAHCTHQSPGEVIALTMNRNTRITGPMKRNLTACRVFNINMTLPHLNTDSTGLLLLAYQRQDLGLIHLA